MQEEQTTRKIASKNRRQLIKAGFSALAGGVGSSFVSNLTPVGASPPSKTSTFGVMAAAFVSANGTLVRSQNSFGTTSVTKVGTGTYHVDFGFRVDQRYVLATIFNPPFFNPTISVWPGGGPTPNTVRVYTGQGSGNTAYDLDFYIAVM